MSRRSRRTRRSPSRATSSPPIRMAPAEGSTRRITQRATVDLQEPDSPTTPRVPPGRTVRSTPWAAPPWRPPPHPPLPPRPPPPHTLVPHPPPTLHTPP